MKYLLACVFALILGHRARALTTVDGLVYSVSGGVVTITGYTGVGGAVSVPATIGGQTVTAVAATAFFDKTAVTSVTLTAGLLSIGNNAFEGCTGLSAISLPASVSAIGDTPFYRCANLVTISVAGANTNYAATGDGKALTNKAQTRLLQFAPGVAGAYTVPSTVTEFGLGAFASCTKLTGVTLPSGMTTVGARAFLACSALTSVSLPSSITLLADSAFSNCTALASITLPTGLVTIDVNAFSYCSQLNNLTLPGSLQTIAYNAFAVCTSLTSITIPASVTALGDYAFSGSTSLSAIMFLGNAPTAGSNLFYSTAATTVYYTAGRTGWSSTYAGLATAVLGAPVITAQPVSSVVEPGTATSMSVSAVGTAPVSYQWRKGGVVLGGATSALYAITYARLTDTGSYDVVITNTAGTVTSTPQTLTVTSSSSAGRLVNLSAQTVLPSGGLAATFTVAGSVQKSVLIRLVGPTLGSFGVAGTLVDPQLTVVNATTGALVASNDDWGTPVGSGAATGAQLTSAFSQVGAFGLVSGSKDSAVLVSLAPGMYTAQFVGAGGTSGVVLCEIYDADASGTFTGTNLFSYLALRSPVATGGLLTAGVVWSGSSAGSVLVRAVGPSLGSTGALADPSLSLFNGSSATIATNNDWSGAAGLSSAFAQVGAFPFTSASSLDSALITPLSAGSYTVRVAPATGSGGITLLEVFDLAVTGGGLPYVVTPPAGQTVSAGSVASFSVLTGGASLITYQWRKDGVAISGATNASYAIGAAVAGDAGAYTVAATNGLGTTTSSAATLVVNRLSQTITFGALATKTYGDAAFALSATASSGLAVTYTSSNTGVATVSGSTVTIVGAGSTTITASQAGNGNYTAASEVSQTLTVNKATATVTLGSLAVTYDGTAKAATATTTPSGLTVNFTYNASATAPTNVGSYAVVGTIANTNYQGSASGTLVIAKANQTITFGALAAKGTSDAPFTLGATASSGLPVSYASSNPLVATVSGSTVTIVGVGTTTITASQPGTTNYNAAANVTQNLTVTTIVAPAITTQPASRLAGVGTGTTFTVVASGTAPLTYQWKKNGGNLTDGGSIAGATTTTLALSNLITGDAGSYTVVVTNAGGTATSNAATLTVVDAQATHAVVGSGYIAGGTVTLTQTLTYTGSCSGLGWQMLLPTGWSYASGGGTEGDVKPSTGTSSLLEWAWTSVPANPVTFTVTLNVPAGDTGDRTVTGLTVFRVSAGAANLLVTPDPLVVSQVTTHSADTDRNFRVSLFELTRVIELYNTRNGTSRTGCYAVQAGTEDGFAPDAARLSTATVTLASYHAADSDHNGKVSLFELTRVIELYNTRAGTSRTGAYHAQAGTEDGFAPGP